MRTIRLELVQSLPDGELSFQTEVIVDDDSEAAERGVEAALFLSAFIAGVGAGFQESQS